MGARGTEPGEQQIRSAVPQPLGPSGAQQAFPPGWAGGNRAQRTRHECQAPPLHRGEPRQILPQSSLPA